jgi:signal transduction histidine kinase
MTIKRHVFEPGAQSIIQMGEELIGHPSTAINELVKNSYDADATQCTIYTHIQGAESFLLIFDNGLGMSNEILFGDWLRPSASTKRKVGVKSKIFERSFLGSKGIGRLAAMALGKSLTVISKTDEENVYNWLSLNSDLFRSEQLLSQVSFPGDVISDFNDLFDGDSYLEIRKAKKNGIINEFLKNKKIENFKEGTLIVIEDIDQSLLTIFKNDFEDQDANSRTLRETTIYRSLSVLITPLQLDVQIQNELLSKKIIDVTHKISKEISTFEVFYGTNIISSLGFDSLVSVKPISLLEKFDYRFLGKATKQGNIKGEFICQRIKEYSYSEEFSIKSEEVFDQDFRRSKSEKKPAEIADARWNDDAGEFYFDIRIYDRGEEEPRQRLFSLIQANSNTQKKHIIDGLLGLRISKNGFSVKPYGEEIKDWLNLGQLRVQNPGQNVSTNQILGYVFFYSPENDGLKEKTNREGFYENKAFIDVKHILQVIFKNIGQLRYNFRLRYNLGRNPQNKLNRPDTQSFIDFIKREPGQQAILRKSEEFVDQITTALENMGDTLSFSQRLASLGTGLELVYHELSQPIAKIGGSRALLIRKVSKIQDQETKDFFIKEITNIGSFVAELDELKSSLKPAIGKSTPQFFKPNHTFKKVCYLFRRDFEEENIQLHIQSESEKFEIEDLEYTLWISFLNIINNAFYWLKLNSNRGKFISFNIEENDRIVIQNNGPLIPEDNIDLIFEYGFTLKKEKNATGLGLAFTKNILNLNNWSIAVENRDAGPAFIIFKNK